MRRSTRTAAATVLGAVVLLGAGCSADIGTTEDSARAGGDAAAPEVAEEPAQDEAAADGDEQQDGGEDVVLFGGSSGAVAGRELARTASVVLEVDDVEQAAARVTAAAQRAGGFVSGAEVRGGDLGYGVLTLRVPADRLDAALTDLGEVGLRVVESSITTEDLSEQLTDIGARIANLERLEAELQLLLADVRTNDPQAGQLLQVFERLNQVRGEVERLEAQRAAARDRVDLATIEVELVPSAVAPEEPAPEGTLAHAWQTTRDAFGAIGDAAIWLVVTILPVAAVLVGLPALLLWGLVRALRRRRAEQAAAAPAVHAPATPAPPSPPTGPADDREPADA